MRRTDIKSEQERSEAIAWDDGCLTDPVRNEFLIPKLRQFFEKERPPKILDLGAGTGYISRVVDSQLGYRPDWTLVDINSERLWLAEERKPPAMRMRHLICSIADIKPNDQPYHAVLLTFTLLEANDVDAMLASAIGSLAANGLLIIAVPDVWRDVVETMDERSTLPRRLLRETISIPKIDKFTGALYPFYAMRTETLISAVLIQFCVLENLERGGPQGEVYLLVFRKRSLVEPEMSCE